MKGHIKISIGVLLTYIVAYSIVYLTKANPYLAASIGIIVGFIWGSLQAFLIRIGAIK